ncbi:glutaredoxin family protein [Desertibacillus haloalkaliphilus]|uniref:glutaredoxin family protein n=1 Tax=Desertibacillus haloalkaliphilus TaxID=1328930 RepID=UPI001C27F8AA|nr:glutaredoxin family protein [Desertibacillus haloalkaliphilus]MBU8908226.1 glutaredoxin family protein [Desertibacillus haloalkaliphilus]
MDRKVVLWSSYTCQLCTELKDFFEENNIQYENKDMKKDDHLRDIIEERYNVRKAPVVEIDEAVVVGGGRWTPENWRTLKQLLNVSEAVK